MLDGIKKFLGLIVRHPKDAAIIFLSLVCIFLNWQIGFERRTRERSHTVVEGLPSDTKQMVTVYRDRVVTKWRDSPTKIIYRDRYLPPEGRVTFSISTDGPQDKSAFEIRDRGFTLRVGGGFVYSEQLLPQVDLKWFYFGRYSLLAGLTPRFGGLGLSRHIDDLTPFKNIEMLGDAGISWRGDLRLAIGLRTNF